MRRIRNEGHTGPKKNAANPVLTSGRDGAVPMSGLACATRYLPEWECTYGGTVSERVSFSETNEVTGPSAATVWSGALRWSICSAC